MSPADNLDNSSEGLTSVITFPFLLTLLIVSISISVFAAVKYLLTNAL